MTFGSGRLSLGCPSPRHHLELLSGKAWGHQNNLPLFQPTPEDRPPEHLIKTNKLTIVKSSSVPLIYIYRSPLRPKVSFSRTWKPFLWNVIIRKDGAVWSLWEDRISTSISASWKAQLASRQPWHWPLTQFFYNVSIPWLCLGLCLSPLHSLTLPLKSPVTSSLVQVGLSLLCSLSTCRSHHYRRCFYHL